MGILNLNKRKAGRHDPGAGSKPGASRRSDTMNIDYYLRLQPEQLMQLGLRHLESHADMEAATPSLPTGHEGAWLVEEIGGYTEWVDAAGAGYSLGWDWYVQAPSGRLGIRPHSIRTNIMLVNPAGADLGRALTEQGLMDWLQRWDWTVPVLEALRAEGCDIR